MSTLTIGNILNMVFLFKSFNCSLHEMWNRIEKKVGLKLRGDDRERNLIWLKLVVFFSFSFLLLLFIIPIFLATFSQNKFILNNLLVLDGSFRGKTRFQFSVLQVWQRCYIISLSIKKCWLRDQKRIYIFCFNILLKPPFSLVFLISILLATKRRIMFHLFLICDILHVCRGSLLCKEGLQSCKTPRNWCSKSAGD